MAITYSTVLFWIFLLSDKISEVITYKGYQLTGFIKHDSIPVSFPKDICAFHIDGTNFAASLHYRLDHQLELVVFKQKNGNYVQVYDRLTPLAVSMDCISWENKAYVAVTYKFVEPIENITAGSPIFEITINEISVVQFMATAYQNALYFRTYGANLYLLQALDGGNFVDTNQCPMYVWSGYHFNYENSIPCDNAIHIESFTINDVVYIMVANQHKPNGLDRTDAVLYRYRYDVQNYVELHRFKAANYTVGMKYFSIENKENLKEHFIVVASEKMIQGKDDKISNDLGGPVVIYKFKNGIFEPFQQFCFHNVTNFLPLYKEWRKFILLIACKNQDMKYIRYNGQSFELSNVQLTSGALTNGVAAMRTFEDHNTTYLVISNERMTVNETNVYLPLYKEHEDRSELKNDLLGRFQHLYEKLTNGTAKIKTTQALIQNFAKGNGHLKNANISEIIAKMVINPKNNFTHEYWNKLAIASKSLAKLEERLLAYSRAATTENDTDNLCNYELLELNTLNVTNQMEIANVNNKTLNYLNLDKIIADEIIVNGKTEIKKTLQDTEEFLGFDRTNRTIRQTDFHEVRVKQIIVTGTVNSIDFNDFSKRILKNHGHQILTAPFQFKRIDASDVQINGTVNHESPSKLVTINGGSFVVDQDIIFAQSPDVHQLVVNDRLNHINVVQGKLEVLLKNTSELQVIDGKKTFENVQLLEPFILRGKINSPHLDKINPVAIIPKNLTLEGDYEITGQVFITDSIMAKNFFGKQSNRNLLEILENGLSVNTENIYQNMDFQRMIKADKFKTNILNKVNLSDLVTINGGFSQVVTGIKTFSGDLYIRKGLCEVENVNGVDLIDLHLNRLQKYADQTITGSIQFKDVHIERLNSTSNIIVGAINLNSILTSSTPQNLSHLTIENLHTTGARVKHVVGKNKIFGQDLDFIINDTLLAGASANITGFKIFEGDFSTHDLLINGKLNHFSIQEIVDSIGSSNEDIVIEQDITFHSAIEMDSISFEGEINGIPAEKFGSCWLTIEGDQNFTAPQVFDELNAQSLHVAKRINNKNLNEVINNIIWVDKEQFLRNITFAQVIAERDLFVNGKINGMQFAESVLLKESSQLQAIEAPVTCDGDLRIFGKLIGLNTFNNIDLIKLQDVLTGNSDQPKLTVDAAIFENPPQFHFLNGKDFNTILNNAWLSNQDAVIEGPMVFNDVQFQSHVDLNGQVNGVDLHSLKENYFSISKDQRVLTPMIFKQPIIFEEAFSSSTLVIGDHFVDTISKRSFNFTELALNNLRTDINQKITGQWKISTVIVQGDLNDVLINGQNLVNDVLRYDVASVQEIKAPKKFNKISIADLECTSRARINDINIIEWMRSSVLIYGNFTIQGATTMDDLIVYEDVIAFDTVNGIKFDENHLMLVDTDQTIHGNVTIRTKFLKMNRILPLSIEHLNVKVINNLNVEDFFENIVPYQDEFTLSENVVFNNTVNVNKFHSIYDFWNLSDVPENTMEYVNNLLKDYENLDSSLKARPAFLSHYKFKQQMTGNIQKILHIKVPPVFKGIEDMIVVLRGDNDIIVTFHRWNKEQDSFDLTNELFSWSANHSTIIDCEKITIHGTDVLVVETFSESMYTKHFLTTTSDGMKVMYQISSYLSEQVVPIVHNQQQCFIVYTSYYNDLKLQCIELSLDGHINLSNARTIRTEDVVFQVLALEAAEFFVATSNNVQIWNLNSLMTPIAAIPLRNPNVISCAIFDNYKYVAVSANGRNVEIYRSFNGSTYYHFQTIEAYNIIDIKFSTILPSQDFLLYVSTTDQKQSLSGYTYRGVVGFQKFFRPINLKPARRFELISLKESSKHFICYATNNEVLFMEAVILRV